MSENQFNTNDWQACPRGEMGRLVAGLRGKRRTRQSMVIGGTSAAVVVLLLIGNIGIGMMQGPEIAGLSCRSVASIADDYVDGNLDPAQTQQVQLHLEKCRKCRAAIDELRKAKTDGNVAAQRWQLFRDNVSRTLAAL